jgi:hypothetical protein
VPVRSKTLNVVLTTPLGGQPVPDWGVRCLCHVVANHCWRVAAEQFCTEIVVHHPSHRHPFDMTELLGYTVRHLGYWPQVQRVNGRVMPLMATRGFQALGATLERHRPVVAVPIAVSSEAGGKEVSHG